MMEILAMFKDYIGLAIIFIVGAAMIMLIAKHVTKSVLTEVQQYHDKRDEKLIRLATEYIGGVCKIFVTTFKDTTKIVEGEKEDPTEKMIKDMFGI